MLLREALSYLEEITIKDLQKNAVSNITKKSYDKRVTSQNNFVSLESVSFVQNDLRLTFSVESSEGDGNFIDNKYTKPPAGFYTVMIQFIDSNKYLTNTINNESAQKALDQIFLNCDVKLFSDDPSFYWQGFWESLDDLDMAIFPFTGKPGDGQWTERHNNSGNLLIGNIRVTKHIKQILDELFVFKDQIINTILSGQTLRENLSLNEIDILNNNEHFIRTKILPTLRSSSDESEMTKKIELICNNNEEDVAAIYSALLDVEDIDKLYDDLEYNSVRLTDIINKNKILRMSRFVSDQNVKDFYLNLYDENKTGRYFFSFFLRDSQIGISNKKQNSIVCKNQTIHLKSIDDTFNSEEVKTFMTEEQFRFILEKTRYEKKCGNLLEFDYDQIFTKRDRKSAISTMKDEKRKVKSKILIDEDILRLTDANLVLFWPAIWDAAYVMLYNNKERTIDYMLEFLRRFLTKDYTQIHKAAKTSLDLDIKNFIDTIIKMPREIPKKFLELQMKAAFYEKSFDGFQEDRILIISQKKNNDIIFMAFDIMKQFNQIPKAFDSKQMAISSIKNRRAKLDFIDNL